MQIILKALALGFLIAGCSVQAKSKGITVFHTLANYQSGAVILLKGGQTDRGEKLPFNVILMPKSNWKTGASSGGLGQAPGLPEWVEVSWQEEDPALQLSSKEWYALSEAERNARVKASAALPVKSARLPIRSMVPVSVIEELEQSPPDPESTYRPLKSLWIYFVWTREGVKVRWQVAQGCCTTLHEGVIRFARPNCIWRRKRGERGSPDSAASV